MYCTRILPSVRTDWKHNVPSVNDRAGHKNNICTDTLNNFIYLTHFRQNIVQNLIFSDIFFEVKHLIEFHSLGSIIADEQISLDKIILFYGGQIHVLII